MGGVAKVTMNSTNSFGVGTAPNALSSFALVNMAISPALALPEIL